MVIASGIPDQMLRFKPNYYNRMKKDCIYRSIYNFQDFVRLHSAVKEINFEIFIYGEINVVWKKQNIHLPNKIGLVLLTLHPGWFNNWCLAPLKVKLVKTKLLCQVNTDWNSVTGANGKRSDTKLSKGYSFAL